MRRTLVGARLLTPTGEWPDVAADVIAAQVPGINGFDAAIDWWVETCLTMITYRRRYAHWRRHSLLAVRNGYPTYWYYRSDPCRTS